MEDESKKCEKCGAVYYRGMAYPGAWRVRRFCSEPCRTAFHDWQTKQRRRAMSAARLDGQA